MVFFYGNSMNKNKKEIVNEIKFLSNKLEKIYFTMLNLRNHCFLRVAYDITVQDKWDLKINKPFTKYATDEQLKCAISLLKAYLVDENKLLLDNKKSLSFRKNSLEDNYDGVLKLF